MSLECPVSPVYYTSAQQKLQSKNAAKKYRFGSPKIRDLLREKCRIRMREARQNCYGSMRRISELVEKEELATIVRQELAEMEADLQLQEEIYKELQDDINAWYAEQLEEEESYLINVGESNDVMCPICQKEIITGGEKHEYKCKCGLSFHYANSPDALQKLLTFKVDAHEQNCGNTLLFYVEPQASGVNMLTAMCQQCDYFCSF